jgi:hypothetical protein
MMSYKTINDNRFGSMSFVGAGALARRAEQNFEFPDSVF